MGNEPIVEHEPPDDVGAETAARFAYQVDLAAQRCISMLTEDEIVAVYCEWHEDYVVRFANDEFELVSVKHRESSQGPWSVAGLLDSGGLKHLFVRARDLGFNYGTRLQTNAGLKPGTSEARALRDACVSGDDEALLAWAVNLRDKLGAKTTEEALQFLRGLSIQADLPKKEDIAAWTLTRLLSPALAALGVSGDLETCYAAIHQVVSEASRAGGREDVVAALADPSLLSAESVVAARVAGKTVDKERLLPIVRAALHATATPLLADVQASAETKSTNLVLKLERGGFGPTALRNAKNLRANWLAYQYRWDPGLPGGNPALDNLRSEVLHLAQRAERAARNGDELYGTEMQAAMEKEVRVEEVRHGQSLVLSDHLLLGLVYDLTEQCDVWWSDKFEIGEQIVP